MKRNKQTKNLHLLHNQQEKIEPAVPLPNNNNNKNINGPKKIILKKNYYKKKKGMYVVRRREHFSQHPDNS